jgi:hypothetical protein
MVRPQWLYAAARERNFSDESGGCCGAEKVAGEARPGKMKVLGARRKVERAETVKINPGAQYEISVDGVPRTYRDRQDIALRAARLLKSRNPNRVVKFKDLNSGEETVVAFKGGSD